MDWFTAWTHQVYWLPSTKSSSKRNVVLVISLSSQDLYFTGPVSFSIVTMYPVAPATGFHVRTGWVSGCSRPPINSYSTSPSLGEAKDGWLGGLIPAVLST